MYESLLIIDLHKHTGNCDLSENGCGGFAGYVCVPEKILSGKPSCISFSDASALPHALVLALQGLVEKGKIKSEQSVLINGAEGGIGIP